MRTGTTPGSCSQDHEPVQSATTAKLAHSHTEERKQKRMQPTAAAKVFGMKLFFEFDAFNFEEATLFVVASVDTYYSVH